MEGRMPADGESLDFRPVWVEHRVARPLDVGWIHGSVSAKHNTDPNIQVLLVRRAHRDSAAEHGD